MTTDKEEFAKLFVMADVFAEAGLKTLKELKRTEGALPLSKPQRKRSYVYWQVGNRIFNLKEAAKSCQLLHGGYIQKRILTIEEFRKLKKEGESGSGEK